MPTDRRVFLVGPDYRAMKGGVSSVLSNLANSSLLADHFALVELATVQEGSSFHKLVFAFKQICSLLKRGDGKSLCHIHICSGLSCWRKLLFLKAAQVKGMKTILHLHGAEFKEFFQGLPSFSKALVRNSFDSADVVIALSESWKEYLESDLGLKNVRVVRNSIDCSRYPMGLPNSSLVVFVGELCERKGVYDLVEALKIVRKANSNFKCVLAGNGEVEKVREIVREAGLEDNVVCPGWLADGDIANLLCRSSIQVLPSYHEGLPMSLIEGMACGNAIVASSIPEIVEEVGGDGSILIAPGNAVELACALLGLLGDMRRVQAMALANRHRAEMEYDNAIVHAQLTEIYNELFDLLP